LAILASVFEGATLAILLPTIDLILHASETTEHWKATIPYVNLPLSKLGLSDWAGLLLVLLTGTFVCAVLKSVFQYLSALTTTFQVRRFAANLRKAIYARYLSFGKLFFDRASSGELHTLLTSYVGMVANAVSNIQYVMYGVCSLLAYLAIMLTISWRLTIGVLAIFPLLHFCMRRLINRIVRTSQSYSESYNELSKGIVNALHCMPLVKAYSNEKFERDRFTRLADTVAGYEFSMDKKSLLVNPVQEIILLAFLFLLVGLIAFMMSAGEPTGLAGYAVYLVVLRRASALFGVFNSVRSTFAGVVGPLDEIYSIFDNKGKFFVTSGEKAFPGISDGIWIKNLTFKYPDGKTALRDVTFSLTRGQTTALVGQSGAGKSTLINLLMRYYDCPPESIFVDNQDLREINIESWRQNISLVSQEAFLFHDTIRSNILYGLKSDISEATLNEALSKSRMVDFINSLPKGIDTVIGDRGVQLSGGEKQRVSIARAILKDSDIVLLDEATSSLDSETERLIQEALEELIEGRTTLVIAHRLSTIQQADQIVVIESGSVVEHGTLAGLLAKKGVFSRYWEQQRI
ncbi:MAG: ABC transporter ATP-binding protein, partial [Bdellovibrionales bacterium]|nr:ABC transporter ATP-binding protein [Bdellovibrionales bacterium]